MRRVVFYGIGGCWVADGGGKVVTEL